MGKVTPPGAPFPQSFQGSYSLLRMEGSIYSYTNGLGLRRGAKDLLQLLNLASIHNEILPVQLLRLYLRHILILNHVELSAEFYT